MHSCLLSSSLSRALFPERIVLPGRASPHRRGGRDPLPSACLPTCLSLLCSSPPLLPVPSSISSPSTCSFVALAANNRRWQSHCTLAFLLHVHGGAGSRPSLGQLGHLPAKISPHRSVLPSVRVPAMYRARAIFRNSFANFSQDGVIQCIKSSGSSISIEAGAAQSVVIYVA